MKTIEMNEYVNNNDDIAGLRNLRGFYGYNQNVYADPALNGFAFAFITKPALFIYPQKPEASDAAKAMAFENMTKDPFFVQYLTEENRNEKDRLIVHQMSFAEFSDVNSLFLPLFTNMLRTFQPTDITMDAAQSFQTKEGYYLAMPVSKAQSETSSSITVSVTETSNLDFTKMIGIWINYISDITNGTFAANPSMLKDDMLDYVSTIYYFVLEPDGRTIRYWSRYVGCYPTAIPYSAQGYQRDSIDAITLDIPFQYMFKEDMNPEILLDFNSLSLHLVTPTFENADYNAYLRETDFEMASGYSTFSSNDLLDKEKLSSGSLKNIVESVDRDPLVLHEKQTNGGGLPGSIGGNYVLSFGKDSLKDDYLGKQLKGYSNEFKYEDLAD